MGVSGLSRERREKRGDFWIFGERAILQLREGGEVFEAEKQRERERKIVSEGEV